MNADDIRQQFNTKTDAIKAKRDLTPRAKQTLLARAFVEARDALAELKQRDADQVNRQREKLERQLFGTTGFNPDPQAIIARRDANDRAAKYETPAEATAAMRRAERDGDRILAKAIASRAADWSGDPAWAHIVHTYVADKPQEADTLRALQDLPDTGDAVWQMRKAIEYSVGAPDGVDIARADTQASQPLDADAA
jgi:hypothetical protein